MFPIGVLADIAGPVGIHTDKPVNTPAPPLPCPVGPVVDAGQSGKPVFAYMLLVAVKGGKGKSIPPPHCGTGSYEIMQGMMTVKVTGIESAFIGTQLLHCQTGCLIGPGPNILVPGPGNRTTVKVGGMPTKAVDVMYKGWDELTPEQQAAVESMPGEVTPAPMEGSDEGVRTGEASPDAGDGGGAEDPNEGEGDGEETQEEQEEWFEFELHALTHGVEYAEYSDVSITVSGGGVSETFTLTGLGDAKKVGPFPAGTGSVQITCSDSEFELDVSSTATYTEGGGGGAGAGAGE